MGLQLWSRRKITETTEQLRERLLRELRAESMPVETLVSIGCLRQRRLAVDREIVNLLEDRFIDFVPNKERWLKITDKGLESLRPKLPDPKTSF